LVRAACRPACYHIIPFSYLVLHRSLCGGGFDDRG
jgi:hypothetical protein